MRACGTPVVLALVLAAPVLDRTVSAQEPATREQAIEQAEREKAQHLTPQMPNKLELQASRLTRALEGKRVGWHSFFDSAYAGGGFTLGLGYSRFVSPYNTLDVRGSYSVAGYKRFESEFIAPQLFKRRGRLSVVGGWREATEVDFYGIGTSTPIENKTNYSFQQPYLRANLEVRPTRRYMTLNGGLEYSQWKQRPGEGSDPSVDAVYTPAELPGLGTTTTYLHSQGTFGFDWRTSPGYSRRGGSYGITVHDYHDRDGVYGFNEVDYEAVQHVPILREAWVLSFRALARTTQDKDGQQVPFFMLPALGGGSTLRGYGSWRFRDRNSLLLQGEWRIMVNRYLDTAFFYDAGKVTPTTSDFDLHGLKTDFGFGVRFHGPFATPLRIEVAKSNEAHQFIFAFSAAF